MLIQYRHHFLAWLDTRGAFLLTMLCSGLQIELYLQKDFEKDAKPRDKSYQKAVLEDIFKKNDHDGDGFISPKEYNVHQHDEL